jgi:hypothetical protein
MADLSTPTHDSSDSYEPNSLASKKKIERTRREREREVSVFTDEPETSSPALAVGNGIL